MLKFLTHKLRTHSINENNHFQNEKDNEDHDSGTESDDEIDTTPPIPGQVADQRNCSISPADTGCSMESPAPDQQDAHSSEEELEVINSVKTKQQTQQPRLCRLMVRCPSSSQPEKRKWSQMSAPEENDENTPRFGNLGNKYGAGGGGSGSGGDVQSSDEEVHSLLLVQQRPVQFRTSPPLEALKLSGGGRGHAHRAFSPPPSKLLNCSMSPRKRTKHTRHVHIQRPHLDFEKMQQLKTRSVTAWKHGGDHGGELSVFCW